jgi:disulfide bond formation protein DsbB
MCWWQRYPHFAAVVFALFGFFIAPKRVWVALAALAIIASGAIGGFHAGVEYGWWEGITGCTSHAPVGGDPLEAVLNSPLIRCDVAPWTLVGISLAGWNFLISTFGGLAVLALLTKK